jgi:hypothetical protein
MLRCVFLLLFVGLFSKKMPAQMPAAASSVGITLRSVAPNRPDVGATFFQKKNTPTLRLATSPSATPTGLHPTFLPRWSATDLPVFCRIEHEVARKLPVMVKFRLGSVEYVDWLEGK